MSVLDRDERGKLDYPEKRPLEAFSKEGTISKLNLRMIPGLGMEPGMHWVKASTVEPRLYRLVGT